MRSPQAVEPIFGWPTPDPDDPISQGADAINDMATAIGKTVYAHTPAGTVRLTAELAEVIDPKQWLVCNGREVSRDTYQRLFAAIGTQFGAGDGSTTFNLPNLDARVPVGVAPNYPPMQHVGAAGGEHTHVISQEEMPSHAHAAIVGQREVLYNSKTFEESQGTPKADGSTVVRTQGVSSNIRGLNGSIHDHGATVSGAGASWAMNITQPFLALNFLIKT